MSEARSARRCSRRRRRLLASGSVTPSMLQARTRPPSPARGEVLDRRSRPPVSALVVIVQVGLPPFGTQPPSSSRRGGRSRGQSLDDRGTARVDGRTVRAVGAGSRLTLRHRRGAEVIRVGIAALDHLVDDQGARLSSFVIVHVVLPPWGMLQPAAIGVARWRSRPHRSRRPCTFRDSPACRPASASNEIGLPPLTRS